MQRRRKGEDLSDLDLQPLLGIRGRNHLTYSHTHQASNLSSMPQLPMWILRSLRVIPQLSACPGRTWGSCSLEASGNFPRWLTNIICSVHSAGTCYLKSQKILWGWNEVMCALAVIKITKAKVLSTISPWNSPHVCLSPHLTRLHWLQLLSVSVLKDFSQFLLNFFFF